MEFDLKMEAIQKCHTNEKNNNGIGPQQVIPLLDKRRKNDKCSASVSTSEGTNSLLDNKILSKSLDKKLNKTQIVCITLVVYSSYLSCGLCYSIGPVLLDLQELFAADTQSISLSFIGQGAGYLIGSIIGGLLIERVASTFYYSLATVGMSTFLAIMAWMPNLVLFIVIYALNTTFLAMVDGGGAVTLLGVWRESRHQDSIVHGSRLMLSIGAALAPIIVGPFLSKNSAFDSNSTLNLMENTNEADLNISYIMPSSYSFSEHDYESLDTTTDKILETLSNNKSIVDLQQSRHTRVRHGLSTVAAIMLFSVILSIIAFIWSGAHIVEHNKRDEKSKENTLNNTKTKKRKGTQVAMVILTAMFYFGYSATELSIFSFIALFVVKELKWQKMQGSLITSVLFGSQALSRLLGIFIAQCLKPSSIMYLDLLIANISAVFLLFSRHLPEFVTWIAVSTFGLGMGSFNGASYCFASKYVESGGILSASMLASSSVSIMGILPFVGYLYDVVGPMCMVYVCLCTGTFTLAVVLVLDCIGRRCGNHVKLYVTDIDDIKE